MPKILGCSRIIYGLFNNLLICNLRAQCMISISILKFTGDFQKWGPYLHNAKLKNTRYMDHQLTSLPRRRNRYKFHRRIIKRLSGSIFVITKPLVKVYELLCSLHWNRGANVVKIFLFLFLMFIFILCGCNICIWRKYQMRNISWAAKQSCQKQTPNKNPIVCFCCGSAFLAPVSNCHSVFDGDTWNLCTLRYIISQSFLILLTLWSIQYIRIENPWL